MPIEIRCPECKKLLRVPDDAAGKRAKCPSCSAVITVPEGSPPAGDSSPFSPLPSQGTGPTGNDPFGQAPPADQPGEVNPYASPTSGGGGMDTIPAGPQSDIVPTVMDIGNVLSRAWEIFKANFWMCVAVFAVAFVLNQVASQVTNIIVMPLQAAGADITVIIAANVLTTLVVMVFNLWLAVGQTMFFIQIARGNDAPFTLLFNGGRFLLRWIGVYILVALIFVGIIGAGALPPLIVFWTTNDGQITAIVALITGLPAFIAWCYVALMLSQVGYLIIDRDMGVIESISVSKTITTGNKLLIFVLMILFALLFLGGMLACCFPLLATGSYAYLMLAVAYLVMTGQHIGARVAVPPLPAT